nr:RNA-directed DNA polymerase, eukaryota [Tanacetum cinerariifolium]
MGNYSNSFASILKYDKLVTEATGREVPSLVLDDTCFSDRDFNLSLIGKVKDITALPNLYVILEEEGFQNFKISYLGGMWVLIELESFTASQKFIKYAGVGSWFSSLQPASNSFFEPKWGELVEWKNIEDNNFSYKQLCVKTKLNEIICERFKVIIQGNFHWFQANEMEGWDPLLRNEDYASSSSDEENEQENEGSRNGETYESDKEVDKVSKLSCMQGDALFYDNDNNKSKESNVQSEDPFNIYDLLNKNKESDGNSKEGELKYPSGFTPKETSVNEGHEKEMEAPSEEVKQIRKTRWDGECVIMGDFNEVRSEHERYGSVFNVQSAAAFNNFISLTNLIDLPLDGYAYTWVHKSATKMSKLDRFLISKGLMASFPHLSAICLDKHLSDHRPILMREMNINCGPTPFRFFLSWFQIEGFDKLVENTWIHMDITDSNGMILLKKKLQALKIIIREWTKKAKKCSYKKKSSIQSKLSAITSHIVTNKLVLLITFISDDF